MTALLSSIPHTEKTKSKSNQLVNGAIAKFTKKLKMMRCILCQAIFTQGEKLPILISRFKPKVAMLRIIFSLRTISACIWLETVSASPDVCMSVGFSQSAKMAQKCPLI